MSDWYALVDCAQDPRLYGLVSQSTDQHCLFAGPIDPALAPACPYIVRLDEREPLLPAWRAHGAGRNWGILCESNYPIQHLRRHFRKFLLARLPDGTIALFRFYDPRVLLTYLNVTTKEQVAEWFEGVEQYVVEDSTRTLRHFRR